MFKFFYRIMIEVDLMVWGLWEPAKLKCYYMLQKTAQKKKKKKKPCQIKALNHSLYI